MIAALSAVWIEALGYLAILAVALRFSRRWSWTARPSWRANGGLLLLLVLLAYAATIWHYGIQVVVRPSGAPSGSTFSDQWWWHLTAILGILTALSTVAQAVTSQRIAREQQWKALQHENERSRAELASLRADLNPALLSGALAAIRAQVHDNPVAAEHGVTQLGNVLQYVLRLDRRRAAGLHRAEGSLESTVADAPVSFEEEWQAVNALFELEALAFGADVAIAHHIEEDVWICRIPPFVLFPLIEGALAWIRTSPVLASNDRPPALMVIARLGEDDTTLQIVVRAFRGEAPGDDLQFDADSSLGVVRRRLSAYSIGSTLAVKSVGSRELCMDLNIPVDQDTSILVAPPLLHISAPS